MSQTESQDKLGAQLDDLGKEMQSQRPNKRGVTIYFQKLHEFRRNFREHNATEGTSTIKSSAKTPHIRQGELIEWVGTHNSNMSRKRNCVPR